METYSASNNRLKEVIVSQTVSAIRKNRMEDFLRNASVHNLTDFVATLYQNYYQFKNMDSSYKKIRYHSFNKLKRRWTNAAVRNYRENRGPKKELRAQFDMITTYYNLVGQEGLLKEFHVKTVEEYMQLCINELEEWAQNPNLLIHTYPYWSQKTDNQKKKSLKTDVLMLLWEIANNVNINQPIAYHSPTIAVDTPFFGISDRMKNQTNLLDEKLGETSRLNLELRNYDTIIPKYKKGLPDHLSVLVSKEFIQELDGKVPDLDSKDFEAFTEILSYRDMSFQTSRQIIFPLSQLVNKLYANNSGKSYDLTTQRLMKLGYYRIAGHNEEGDFFIRGLFSSVTIKNSTTLAESQVIVTLSEEIYDDLLKQQIVSIYGKQIEQLKGSFAYHLAFVLQKERMSSIQAGEQQPIRRHWRQFTYSIRFNKVRKADNLKELEVNLDRIKKHDFILKDWYRSGDYYFFHFYPLESWELPEHPTTFIL
ncbi:conserved hypothetical protein [Exiguobacterium sp. 8H]|uniref:hypothetical protein n=1 Tax=unclassified Exiguobacterium TaxID=2644629 RepID=UPI0012EEE72A|nr:MULTISPECIES: hypothetical protein [unclassified Exiguobacterium]VXB83591.1 conserved hypothetical protein [Exiguobacterium sp. 8H]VXB93039.1 conserved hypothetical protein [Exiguobacterium sp. 8A]